MPKFEDLTEEQQLNATNLTQRGMSLKDALKKVGEPRHNVDQRTEKEKSLGSIASVKSEVPKTEEDEDELKLELALEIENLQGEVPDMEESLEVFQTVLKSLKDASEDGL